MKQGPVAVVILISGRGSNMRAIVEQAQAGELPIRVRAVISNNPDAQGLEFARAAGIPTQVVNHRDYASRDDYDQALIQQIDSYAPQLLVLAGFMRILSPEFVAHYHARMINIHPSLLPDFPGLDTHARALAAGVKLHGASVHFVSPQVDAGPIIIQAAVAVLPSDTPETLAARVLQQEHRIYPQAIHWFAQGRLSLKQDQVLLDGKFQPQLQRLAPENTAQAN